TLPRPPPGSTLFPYTTLFRSGRDPQHGRRAGGAVRSRRPAPRHPDGVRRDLHADFEAVADRADHVPPRGALHLPVALAGAAFPAGGVRRSARMTFVTVGNATDGFRRLLGAVATLAGDGLLPTPIVIQSGHNPGFVSPHAVVRAFMPMEEFEDHVRRARLVISHAGAGTVLNAMAARKVPVV